MLSHNILGHPDASRLAQIIAAHGEQRRLQNAGKPRAGAPIAPETGLMGAGGSGTAGLVGGEQFQGEGGGEG